MPKPETAARGREIRAVKGLRVETRAAAGGAERRLILGHASVFDQWTTLYEGRYFVWREVVRPGAFNSAIAERQDVRALFNHDPNFLLGRTKSGTLKLSVDQVGLWTETDPPDAQWAREQVIGPIDRGDMDGMSFAFGVRPGERTVTTREGSTVVIDRGGERITIRQEGDVEIEERELLDLDLFDISPVVYPAYEGTDVSMRAMPTDADVRAYARDRDRPRPAGPSALSVAVRSRLLRTLAAE